VPDGVAADPAAALSRHSRVRAGVMACGAHAVSQGPIVYAPQSVQPPSSGIGYSDVPEPRSGNQGLTDAPSRAPVQPQDPGIG
jgi:hypothetical protein